MTHRYPLKMMLDPLWGLLTFTKTDNELRAKSLVVWGHIDILMSDVRLGIEGERDDTVS